MLTAHHLRRQLAALEAAGRIVGEVILVPMANPIGLSQHVLHSHLGRFELTTGENFNRHYPDQIEAVATAVESHLGPDPAANVKLLRTALRQAIEASPAEIAQISEKIIFTGMPM